MFNGVQYPGPQFYYHNQKKYFVQTFTLDNIYIYFVISM